MIQIMRTITMSDATLTCEQCGLTHAPPQLPGAACRRRDCPYHEELSRDGQKLLQVLLNVTARWANGGAVDGRVLALAYGGAAGACFLTMPMEDRLRIVWRMCDVLIATTEVGLEIIVKDSCPCEDKNSEEART